MVDTNAKQCKAALNIKGEHFPCEVSAPHLGLAHSNKKAEAIWACEIEAARFGGVHYELQAEN